MADKMVVVPAERHQALRDALAWIAQPLGKLEGFERVAGIVYQMQADATRALEADDEIAAAIEAAIPKTEKKG